MKKFCRPFLIAVLVLWSPPMLAAASDSSAKPNIFWITIEDWSTDLSCYGTKGILTLHVDRLAAQGIRYEHAFSTSPVCSTSRSAMMTGGLEQMQLVDRQVGTLLKRLEDEGLADNTLVFFTSDHGRCHIRGKQFLYDGGIRIPLIVRWPGRIKPGQGSEELVMSIDICATVLEAAGVKPPVPLHGRSLFSSGIGEREYVFTARDRMGDTHDAMRCVRSRTHKLILNLMPERAWCQYSGYKESSYPMLAEMNLLNRQGQLTPAQAAFFAAKKPRVELFDLRADPHETNNVADDPKYVEIRQQLLAKLDDWRNNVIQDAGVSDDFRAKGVFPASCPAATVDRWVHENKDKYDFRRYGLPSWYPTRTLEAWQKVRERWEPYVFRKSTDKMPRPNVNASFGDPTKGPLSSTSPGKSTLSTSRPVARSRQF